MVSDDDEENLTKYIKPASEYKNLDKRSKNSPYFLRRCLNYIIQAKRKRRSNSGATIVFNYRNSRNDKTLKVEVVKKSSCPFCLMLCGSMEGLRLHLISSHDVFNYVFYEEDHGPEIDVYLKPDAFRFGVQKLDPDNNPWIPFTFCSKRPRPRKRDNSNNMKRINLRLLELDINEAPHDTETELTQVNDDDSVSSPPRAHSLENTSEFLTPTQPEIAQSSEPEVPHVSRRKKLLAVAEQPTAIEIERLKNRQFYHSQSMQPMTFEHVMTGEDSENEDDHEALDINERMRLERYVGVSKEAKRYMYLWNILVRRQRVIVDAHVPWLCEEFSKLHKEELKGHSFNWWWRQFLIKLWDYGLVCAKTINKCNTIIQNSDEAGPSTSQGIQNSDEAGPSTSQGAANANTQDFMDID